MLLPASHQVQFTFKFEQNFGEVELTQFILKI